MAPEGNCPVGVGRNAGVDSPAAASAGTLRCAARSLWDGGFEGRRFFVRGEGFPQVSLTKENRKALQEGRTPPGI